MGTCISRVAVINIAISKLRLLVRGSWFLEASQNKL